MVHFIIAKDKGRILRHVIGVNTLETSYVQQRVFVIAGNSRPVADTHSAIHNHVHHHCPVPLAVDTAAFPFAADGRNWSHSDTDGRRPDHPHTVRAVVVVEGLH